jgi:hypothetical protein
VKDLDVLLADESLVLILDDTEHVWEKHRANLIQVSLMLQSCYRQALCCILDDTEHMWEKHRANLI